MSLSSLSIRGKRTIVSKLNSRFTEICGLLAYIRRCHGLPITLLIRRIKKERNRRSDTLRLLVPFTAVALIVVVVVVVGGGIFLEFSLDSIHELGICLL